MEKVVELVRDRRPDVHEVKTRLAQLRMHDIRMEGCVNGVAGASVGEAEIEQVGGPKAPAGAAHRDARGRELAEGGPGVSGQVRAGSR